MKRILLFTAMFMLGFMKMQAQREITINGYDGTRREAKAPKQLNSRDTSIQYGRPLILKITGVNPFLHKVEVLDSVVSFKYELPTDIMSTFSGVEIAIPEGSEKSASDGGWGTKEADTTQNCKCQRKLNQTLQLLLAASQNPSLSEDSLKQVAIRIMHFVFPRNNFEFTVDTKGNDVVPYEIVQKNNKNYNQSYKLAEYLFKYLSDQGCCKECTVDEKHYEDYVKLIQAITKLFNAIMFCSFDHTTDVIYPHGDGHDFNIRITPLDSLEYGTGQINRNQHLRFWTKNKFNINLSGGFGFSGLQNNTFSFQMGSGADSTSKKIVLQNRETFRYGAAIAAHFYSRFWYNVNPAFSLGVMYDSEKKVNPTAGLSLIFGHRNRLVLSGGIAMGKETRLAKGYEEDVYVENLGEDIPTREVNRVTWYVGLTFNKSMTEVLSGRKK